jgi:HlyD family secretion protein
VSVTWDALPGREWRGTVEKMPTQIVALGSRQVGEVLCRIDNPDQRLLPQTNINAQIRTNVAENALTIPKEVLRRENGETGVFTLQGPDNTVRWQAVKLGTASVTRLEVVSGLGEDRLVALPTDVPLQTGMRVTPSTR